MSWAEPESGVLEPGENPDPEEDSDLPARQASVREVPDSLTEGEELQPEEDSDLPARQPRGNNGVVELGREEPEEDFVPCARGGAEGDANAVVGCGSAAGEGQGGGGIEEASGSRCDSALVQNSILMNSTCKDEERALRNVDRSDPEGIEYVAMQAEGDPVHQNVSVEAESEVHGGQGEEEEEGEGDSFEQDEQLAAPESESEPREQACSESDQQLIPGQAGQAESLEAQVNEELTHSGSVEGSSHSPQQAKPHHEAPYISVSLEPGETDTGETRALTGVDEERGAAVDQVHTFSGNVDVVASTGNDAPEDESSDVSNQERQETLEVETLSAGTPRGNCPPSIMMGAERGNTPQEESETFQHGITSRSKTEEGSSEIPQVSADQNLQAPECDRQSVILCEASGAGTAALHTRSQVKELSTEISIQQDNATECGNVQNDNQIHSEQGNVAVVHQGAFHQEGAPQQEPEGHTLTFSHPHEELPSSESNEHLHHSTTALPPTSISQPGPYDSSQSLAHSTVLHDSPGAVSPESLKVSTVEALDSGQKSSGNVDAASTGLQANSKSSRSPKATSPHSSSVLAMKTTLSRAMAMDSCHIQRELALALQSDEEDDDILSELDAELLAKSSPSMNSPPKPSHKHLSAEQKKEPGQNGPEQLPNGMQPVNTLTQDLISLKNHNRQLLEQLVIRDEEIKRLTSERDAQREELKVARCERDNVQALGGGSPSADDLYLPQIKELEKTLAEQQQELRATKDKLAAHDNAAKRAVTTLQHELKNRVEQVTKMYEECLREKDMMVVKFAESEAKTMEAKRQAEKLDGKMKEAVREKENMGNALKAALNEKHKAVSNFDGKCTEVTNLHREMEKLKEALQSMEYRIKWFQNKLKDELEAHKETKSNLEKMTGKLKEAKEETAVIRMECQAIVKTYQESEEIKSNSLDKELKMKESELKLQMQEKSDTEEIHQMIKKELESLKAQHKDTLEEVKTYKDKVHCLEEELYQNHQMIENYQSIMQRQKGENSELRDKLNSLANLDEEFTRAQDMIKTLDKDITELKITNKDLQKDMESCHERESKMLSLQSELSRTNAMLRSENTNLSNKCSTLTGAVEQLRMEVQELETSVKDLSDKYEEEKRKRKEEGDKTAAQLTEKSKESSDFKRKWEDEMDNTKTLKRRHANNVKDLTRQLQQVKRKLESIEGKGDASSMGSRTNSNGSLNSMETSHPPQPAVHQSPPQEYPVITEQVEVDKQVLIERIVRLQKSHARKNEKLEFLGEHIQQLLEEIKKKNKIIQSYVMREEAGTLSSEDMDANKAQAQREMQTLLARKGGIMASVYSVHQQDGNMTLDLSLQINKKLQAVLEDTLLKNITLKENLDTLGEEIARLSQQNRKLQLHLQDLERK